MKQQWQKLSAKIDALTLRERAIIFFMAVVALVALFTTTFIDPNYNMQKQALQRMDQDREQIAAKQAEIASKTRLQGTDPDKADKMRLQQLHQQAAQMRNSLLSSQKSLVAPDKIPALLESILKKNRKLTLVSLRTLEVSSLADATEKKSDQKGLAGAAAKPEKENTPDGMDAVYNHAVEITLKGSYLDIMSYLQQLEAMPWQLYWDKAEFKVIEYPDAVLTLTLSTMSLDKKWLNL
jgi:MSHA biogenesis protein MshJ